MKEIIIDYENTMLITKLPSQQGSEHILEKLDKLHHINSLGDIPADMYMTLCKAAIIGYNFEDDKIHVYKPIMYDNTNGALYPDHLLQIKSTYSLPGFAGKFDEFLSVLGYEQVDFSPEISLIEAMLNR